MSESSTSGEIAGVLEAGVVIDINPRMVNSYERLARNLFNIRRDEDLNWLLDDWQKDFKVALDRIETKSTRTNHAKNDLYQWIGFFTVFQGVVLTAVAQSSTLGCQQSWAPATLSFIASLVTVVTVHFKLVDYSVLNGHLFKEIHRSQILNERLQELRAQGTEFDFSWFDHRWERKEEFKGLSNFFYWAVISALAVFSAIILLCCILVLCGPHRHKPGT